MGAFYSISLQITGLIGLKGIFPVTKTLLQIESFVQSLEGKEGKTMINFIQIFMNKLIINIYKRLATQFSSSPFLKLLSYCGIALSFFIFIFPFNPISFLLIYVLYTSFKRLFGIFLNLQWDILLLEVTFIMIFWSIPTQLVISKILLQSALSLVLFRLMIGSGIVKLQSNCGTWINLTAMNYHFLTQPLPGVLAPTLHLKLSHGFLKISVFATLFIEGPLCLFQFIPYFHIQWSVCGLYIVLQVLVYYR